MNGRTTTTLRLFFEFAPMVQFRLPSSTYLDLYMTVRLLSTAIFTISWREYFCQLGQSAALTLHLAMCRGNSSWISDGDDLLNNVEQMLYLDDGELTAPSP